METEMVKLWKCPKCRRQFQRQGQSHSCRLYQLELHFKGKPGGKRLYETFKRAVQNRVGHFKIESLECCIHFVSTITFAAIEICKEKIRVGFSIPRRLKSKRIIRMASMSANRYLYYFEIVNEDDIDEELLECMQESHDKTMVN